MSNKKNPEVIAIEAPKANPAKAAEPKPEQKLPVKSVKIERLDVKGNGKSYRGFTTLKGKVCSVKVRGSWEDFVPGCEVPSSNILELDEATEAQLKRYNNAGHKKAKINMTLLVA